MDIKPITKRASGQAFEVILKPSSPVTDAAHCVTTPPKRDLSLEDIQKKLEAAEDRRRVRSRHVSGYYPHTCASYWNQSGSKLKPVERRTSCDSPR